MIPFTVSWILFTLASFFSITAIGVDRFLAFLAIHLHLSYKELVTRERVVVVVVLIWVFGASISLADLWIPVIVSAIVAITLATCFIATIIIYYKIYFAVQRHRNQIQVLLLQ